MFLLVSVRFWPLIGCDHAPGSIDPHSDPSDRRDVIPATYPRSGPSNNRSRGDLSDLADDRERIARRDRGQDAEAIKRCELIGAADRLAVEHDLGHRVAASQRCQIGSEIGRPASINLLEGQAPASQQGLRAGAMDAPRQRVDSDLGWRTYRAHLQLGHRRPGKGFFSADRELAFRMRAAASTRDEPGGRQAAELVRREEFVELAPQRHTAAVQAAFQRPLSDTEDLRGL